MDKWQTRFGSGGLFLAGMFIGAVLGFFIVALGDSAKGRSEIAAQVLNLSEAVSAQATQQAVDEQRLDHQATRQAINDENTAAVMSWENDIMAWMPPAPDPWGRSWTTIPRLQTRDDCEAMLTNIIAVAGEMNFRLYAGPVGDQHPVGVPPDQAVVYSTDLTAIQQISQWAIDCYRANR